MKQASISLSSTAYLTADSLWYGRVRNGLRCPWLVFSLLGAVLFDSALARVPMAAFGSDTAGYYPCKAEFHD
jgi:hypothetical protein